MSRPVLRFDTVVLIHDLAGTAESWAHWIRHYSEQGYRVIARSWQCDPSAAAHVEIGPVVGHYQGLIRELGRPPLIIGHAFGGLITQILLERGPGTVGAAIAAHCMPARIPGVSVAINDRARLLLTAGELDQEGWRKVADHVLGWAARHAVPGVRKR